MLSRLSMTFALVSLLGAAPALAAEDLAPRGEAPSSAVAGALPVGTYEDAIDTGDVVYFSRPSASLAATASPGATSAKPDAVRHHAATARDCPCHRG